MYCSGCGQELTPEQTACPRCGRPVTPIAAPLAAPIPPVAQIPGFQFELESYRNKIRTLAIVWFVYAGFALLTGFAGLTFARHMFWGGFGPGFGPWAHGTPPPNWFFPSIFRIAWFSLVIRTALAVAAGWGLLEQASWGRVVAIIVAILSLIKFPFGTAMGIWTLVVLLGYRNATLYEQL